jgi:Fur family ferric uptake transcriptional regulator
MTRQRRVILEELRRRNDHPSADELYRRVRRRLPRISLGTVYRNLEVLSDIGEIRTLGGGAAIRRFDGVAAHHYHIRCVGCDRIEDAPLPVMAGLEDRVAGRTGFELFGHRLEFSGLCPACRKTPGP